MSKNTPNEIPLVKTWLEELSVPERVLCVTTVDSYITHTIKYMFQEQQKVSISSAKFRMQSDY